MGPLLSSFPVKWTFWLGAMLDGIPYLMIRSELLGIGAASGSVGRKDSPIPSIEPCPCEGELLALSGWKGPAITDLPTSGWSVSSYLGLSIGLFLLADWTFRGSSSQNSLCLCHCDQLLDVPGKPVPGWPMTEWLSHLTYVFVQFSSMVDALW